jgi:hypothetical protein
LSQLQEDLAQEFAEEFVKKTSPGQHSQQPEQQTHRVLNYGEQQQYDDFTRQQQQPEYGQPSYDGGQPAGFQADFGQESKQPQDYGRQGHSGFGAQEPQSQAGFGAYGAASSDHGPSGSEHGAHEAASDYGRQVDYGAAPEREQPVSDYGHQQDYGQAPESDYEQSDYGPTNAHGPSEADAAPGTTSNLSYSIPRRPQASDAARLSGRCLS